MYYWVLVGQLAAPPVNGAATLTKPASGAWTTHTNSAQSDHIASHYQTSPIASSWKELVLLPIR